MSPKEEDVRESLFGTAKQLSDQEIRARLKSPCAEKDKVAKVLCLNCQSIIEINQSAVNYFLHKLEKQPTDLENYYFAISQCKTCKPDPTGFKVELKSLS